jgi:acetylornithine deacetylase
MVLTERVAQILSELVRIPSVTPTQAGPRAGEPGEARMATHVEERFKSLGAEVDREDVFPGRPNIYGIWRGTSDRWIGVDVHTDTVGVEQMLEEPFDGRVANGRVHGRGSVDTKATLAIVLAILEEMRAAGRKPAANLIVSATADEEVEAHGATVYANWLKKKGIVLDQLFVAEPTLCRPVHGHKGAARLYFDVEGVSCHSSMPEKGKNAITAAARIVLAMEQEHARLQREAPATPVGKPTLTVTIMNGGIGINVVPPACRVGVDRRIVAGEHAADVAKQIEQIARNACELPMNVQMLNVLDAFYQPADSPLMKRLKELGCGDAGIVPYGTNAFAYGETARECVVIGPGSIEQAHGNVEWVEIAELEKMTRIYESVLR